MIDQRIASQAAALLGASLSSSRPLAGGDLNAVLEIVLADGRRAVAKTGPAPRVEAAMLAAIAAAGAPAPRVLAVDETVLVLQALPNDGALWTAWSDLGLVLAALHAATGPHYGWSADYAFGRVTIENTRSHDWPTFWAERRLLNQCHALPISLSRRVERVASDLANRLPATPRPALLHGDLWGGNVLVSGSRISGLIDPACYYGDREVDFAMLCLFDRPRDALFSAAGALEPGHAERLPIYQLWPALVHLNLFGMGYAPMVERMLAAVGC